MVRALVAAGLGAMLLWFVLGVPNTGAAQTPPTATATATFPPPPTPTSTPQPAVLLTTDVTITTTDSSDTAAAEMVPVDIGYAALGISDADRILVCPEATRCWENTTTPYPDNAAGPVHQAVDTTHGYSLYVPALTTTGASVRYDIYILRADLTRTALGTVPSNDGGGSHSISLGSWEAYQPLALSTPSPDPNWLGPAEPDTGFEVEDDSPRLPGFAFLGEQAEAGGYPKIVFWVMVAMGISMIVIAVVQRLLDNIIYSCLAGGVALVVLSAPAVGLATIWVMLIYSMMSLCTIIVGRRISAGL